MSVYVHVFATLILGVCAATAQSMAASEVSGEVRDSVSAVYRKMDEKLQLASSVYTKADSSPEAKSIVVEKVARPGVPMCYSIDRELLLHVRGDNMSIQMLVNKKLDADLETSVQETIPRKTCSEAIQMAKWFVALFNLTEPDGLEITTCSFGKNYKSAWEVRWTRVEGGYAWDTFSELDREGIVVVFHEEKGLVLVGRNIYSPRPRKIDVNIKKEEAIARASLYIPLVQRSRFYREARKDGFVANRVTLCELRVCIPNWLLDPARASWVRTELPNETRLCWFVKFSTVDAKADERPLNPDGSRFKLMPPDMVIYLDASTGECVGADFN